MGLLITLRLEIFCLILLTLLFGYGQLYKLGKEHAIFRRICFFSLGHVAFDIITLCTVNNLETVPNWVNVGAHIIFYLFAILFAQEFLCYILALCYPAKAERTVRLATYAPIGAFAVAMPFIPIDFVVGNGINYSYGWAAFVGYGLAMLFFLSSAVVVIINFKKLPVHIKLTIIPMLVIMVGLEITQVLVPEFLFTGAAATLTTVSFFFSLENPAKIFKQKLLCDAMTGVKSRNSYDMDFALWEKEYAANRDDRFCLVYCDINNLKQVNDQFGHSEGDVYISVVASVLTEKFKEACGLYRMGGDEFLAVFEGVDETSVRKLITDVHGECDKLGKNKEYEVSVSIGYAFSGKEHDSLQSVLRVADYYMYQNKTKMKKQFAYVDEEGRTLNIVGLTDRIFDAFSAMNEDNFLTICNMTTNVSRWSKSAVGYFGLPGEFIFDCLNIWMNIIHPDDRDMYQEDISAVFAGKRQYHDITYRARNIKGDYVLCECRGTILKGKNGEPDLFAAVLMIKDRTDS